MPALAARSGANSIADVTVEFITELIRTLVPLFVIVSPIGAVPLFLSMTANDSRQHQRRTAFLAAVTQTCGLTIAAIAGQTLFGFFGITIGAFQLAGAVLLFLYAMDMVQMRMPRMKTTDEEVAEGTEKEQVGVIPLGIPMLCGPGAMATVMLLRLQASQPTDGNGAAMKVGAVFVAIAVLGVISWLMLLLAVRMHRWLGQVGLGIFVRVEGLLLAAIAVQMAVSGIQGCFGLAK